MASKSPSELIREIQLELAALRGVVAGCDRRVDDANLPEIRERLAKIESLLEVADFGSLITRIATLEEQNTELKKWREESDRRRWQTVLLFGGSLLTLAIQLTVLFLKK